MISLGLDIGYSSVKIAAINEDRELVHAIYRLHKGNLKLALRQILGDAFDRFTPSEISLGAVTGSGSRFLVSSNAIQEANEIAAIVEGSRFLEPGIRSIVDIGGQSARYITDFYENTSHTRMSMNTNCSAGTGSFLEEQVSRLKLKLDDYSDYIDRASSIPRIAGRCSVFAKTDIIHHQQEGVPVADILLGLAYAVIRNFKGAVMRKLPLQKPIFFAGGVAHNRGIIIALKDTLKLDDKELVINDYFGMTGAIGAALLALDGRKQLQHELLLKFIQNESDLAASESEGIKLPALASFGGMKSAVHTDIGPDAGYTGQKNCFLGLDIGSTSTNLVLVDDRGDIIDHRYLRTLGDPIQAVEKGFSEIRQLFRDSIHITGVGVTGSGRYLIGKLVGADVIRDEISAQAKAAVTIDPEVDTIFEIGGQDSKYISLKDGIVRDFQMNKICAAGTGSFLEEQAAKFNIPIDQFGEIALSGADPIHLGERCTVFIETAVASAMSGGAKIPDIAAGLCYAIANNYLSRVVGRKPIGKRIFFQGGVANNQGVINAFKSLVSDNLTVPPFFSVTGAYGAALLARADMDEGPSRFKGFDLKLKDRFREERKKGTPDTKQQQGFRKHIESIVFEGYDGVLDPDKKTVGIPRALFTYGMFPMFNTFFKELGFNVLLSEPSSEYTIGLGQEYALDETCYPVKLVNGHVAELVWKKVDYIFFPDLYTVDHPGSNTRQNYGCAYMQLAFKMVNRAMSLDDIGIELLAPTIAFHMGQEFMMKEFSRLGEQLGKSLEQTREALQKSMQAIMDFENRMEESAQETMKNIRPDEKVFVMLSKIYGVADPVLNMGIPEKLMDMGYKVIPFFQLPETDIDGEHPNMFWPFGQHILEPARLIREHPNLFAIFLTHHGCGPDSVFSHYFREFMGDKPCLAIEVDEHSSPVGVITRVEAFVSSLEAFQPRKAGKIEEYIQDNSNSQVRLLESPRALSAESTVFLPHLYPYNEIFQGILNQKGIPAAGLPRTDQQSSETGKQFSMAEEYFSLTALLGDTLSSLQNNNTFGRKTALMLPQTEGAEVEGQYSRLIRTRLDEEGYDDVDIISPFLEDFPDMDRTWTVPVFLGILAGDIIRVAPSGTRQKHLDDVLEKIRTNRLDPEYLIKIAFAVKKDLASQTVRKRILALGEIFVLYNDFLNDFTFQDLEQKGYGIVFAPLGEYLWMIWQDFAAQNPQAISPAYTRHLDEFKGWMNTIDQSLGKFSPFEKTPEDLVDIADGTVGFYAGAGGRYRTSKQLSDSTECNGIINVFSMYENTGITLKALHDGFVNGAGKPVLNLTFDGNQNHNDKMRVESFVYYL